MSNIIPFDFNGSQVRVTDGRVVPVLRQDDPAPGLQPGAGEDLGDCRAPQ